MRLYFLLSFPSEEVVVVIAFSDEQLSVHDDLPGSRVDGIAVIYRLIVRRIDRIYRNGILFLFDQQIEGTNRITTELGLVVRDKYRFASRQFA